MDSLQDAAMPGQDGLDDGAALLEAVPDREALLGVAARIVRRVTDCDAVGIRLRQGDDYPYFVADGFAAGFVASETSLCAKSGEAVVDPAARPVLECMCGAVIQGRVDPRQPWFTAFGSFFTGSTSRLLAQAEALPPGTRNRCNAAGYETVVLIPLRAADTTHGLLQVNDRRPDLLDASAVARLERLAAGLAILLSRQEMAAALADSEARHRAMFFSNIAIKLLIDPATGRIVDANPAACRFYGYSLEDMQRLSIWDINAAGEDATRREMALTSDAERRFFRFRHRLAGGEVREVEVYTGPVEYLGRKLLFSIIHDVTERVRAEEARDRVEQMLRHDLRSPLAGIAGLAGHLAEGELTDKQREIAAVIRDTAAGLGDMVSRNLDLCRIEQGRYELRPQPVALAALLRRQASLAAPLARRRQAELAFGPGFREDDDGPLAAGEEGLLTTAFSNLVTNALEAAPPGTAVTLSLAVEADTAVAGVHNHGVIPLDIRGRFAAKYATSGKPGGTGLGAYIARTIARLHGGELHWETDETAGTHIRVRLPLYREPSGSSAA
jgi:PAS domain S-box-containing protein